LRFSAKGEYGVRAVLDIALNSPGEPVQVREIARRQNIPERFLEHVMSSLKKGGLVESYRGAQGGYALSRDPAGLSLADVLQAVEGPIVLAECVNQEPLRCDAGELCVIRDVWRDVQKAVLDALAAISIADLCARYSGKRAPFDLDLALEDEAAVEELATGELATEEPAADLVKEK